MKQALIALGSTFMDPSFFAALIGSWLGQITFAKRAARTVFHEEHTKAHNMMDTGT